MKGERNGEYIIDCHMYGNLLLVLQTAFRVYFFQYAAAAGCDRSFVGLLTGQMYDAMVIGGAMQLVYLGVTSTPGGNVPNDPALAGCISIPIGVLSGMSPEVAISLAVPFGIIGAFVDQLRRTTNTIWVHKADKFAENGDTKGIFRCAYVYPSIMGFIIRFPIVFIICFLEWISQRNCWKLFRTGF